MPSRTAEYIDAQKQQADALARAQASGTAAGQTAAIQSTPPGYITGFKTVLTPELKIDIYPGVVEVAGQRVELEEKYTLRPEDETITRLSKAWWYLYIDRSGVIHGDIIPPEFKPEWMAYYHRNQPWRNFGRYFVCDDHLCYYAANWQQASEQTVYVAPSTFGGIASYYCTGVDDQILINAAIKYLHEAYNGGTVNILQGNVYISSSILHIHSNIAISGVGDGTIINVASSGYYIFDSTGTSASHISGISIMELKAIESTSSILSAIYWEYVDNSIIDKVTILNPAGASAGGWGGISLVICSYDKITNNILDGQLNVMAQPLGIAINLCSGIIINNNIIRRLRSSSAWAIQGIRLHDTATVVSNTVSNNSIYDFSSSNAAGYSDGIWCDSDYATITANRIENMKNSNTATLVRAIVILGTSVSVTSNYCYNNGADAGIANTNRNNFYDVGTDTQVG